MKSKNKHYYTYSVLWQFFSYYVKLLLFFFYRKISVKGFENIPKNLPVLFAPNHQNALMDPLVIYYATGKQIVFMARADVFSNPILRKIFTWLKILPIYRMRDGKESLQNNDNTFEIAMEILENKMQVGIFPEAQHSNRRRLLPLKKGIPRVAFLAEERNNFSLDIQVVPVGIYYSNFLNMRSDVKISFGKPIAIKDFKNEYENSPQKAMLSLREEMRKKLSPLIINIQNSMHYFMYEYLINIFSKGLSNHIKKPIKQAFKTYKTSIKIVNILDKLNKDNEEVFTEIINKTKFIKRILKQHKIKKYNNSIDFSFYLKNIFSTIAIIASLPIVLYGIINHLIPYLLVFLLLSKVKDKQFYSTIKFLWGLFVFPIFYIIQILVISLFIDSNIYLLYYAISLPISGLFARFMMDFIKDTINNWRLIGLKTFSKTTYKDLQTAYNYVFDILKQELD